VKTFSTPKEALLDAGRIKAITRGRISRDNHEWLDKEIAANRIRITGVTVVKSETAKGEKRVSVKSPSTQTEKHIADIYIPRPKHEYTAIGIEDNKVYGMAEVCNVCRVSLVQCVHDFPTILGGIQVKVVPNG